MALPQTVIYYSVNDLLKCHIKRAFTLYGSLADEPLWAENILPPVVGAVSRLVSVITISPLELMRTKMQSKPMTIRAFCDTAKSIVVQVSHFASFSFFVWLSFLPDEFFAGWVSKFMDWRRSNTASRCAFFSYLLVHF